MTQITLESRAKQQWQFDLSFGRTTSALPGAEDLYRCIQCGTCSSTCPLSGCMTHTPRRIIAMTRAGLKDDVLRSSTIWLCSSCYSCTVACPKQIRITDIMYSLKRQAKEMHAISGQTIPVLAEAFIDSVARTGRSNESRIILTTWLRTKPFELVRQAWLGIRLWLNGRLSLGTHRMSGKHKDMRKLLHAVNTAPLAPRKD